MQGSFATDPTATVINGRLTIDPSRRYYYGNSQGGIFGLNYMALSTDVERGCLGVPGVRAGATGVIAPRPRRASGRLMDPGAGAPRLLLRARTPALGTLRNPVGPVRPRRAADPSARP